MTERKEAERFLAFTDPTSRCPRSIIEFRTTLRFWRARSACARRVSRGARNRSTGTRSAAALHEITARIAIVGHMHRLLSTRPDSTEAGFGAHLRELSRLFISALAAPGQWELIDTGTTDCPVSADTFLPLSLIVTEVVTNALKYAHPAGAPGKLTVGCRREPGGPAVIEVSDDGVGFPEGFEFTAGGGIGSRTIHVLAQQIDAEISFNSRATGLRFELRLPVTEGVGRDGGD
jgi:two-component sensor histidine kinase